SVLNGSAGDIVGKGLLPKTGTGEAAPVNRRNRFVKIATESLSALVTIPVLLVSRLCTSFRKPAKPAANAPSGRISANTVGMHAVVSTQSSPPLEAKAGAMPYSSAASARER